MKHTTEEKGSALLMAVFVLVLLAGMGTALLFLSHTEIEMSRADLRGKQAFFLAEAGLEAARLTIYDSNKGDTFNDDLEAAAGGGTPPTMEFDPDSLIPIYDANGNVTGFTGYGDDVPLVDFTSQGEGSYIAFLTNDPLDGRGNLNDSNERVMITAIGAGPDRSLEMVQAVIEQRSIFPSHPPATITILGPAPYFDGGTSAAKQFVGDDCAGSGIPGLYAPVLGVIGSAATADPCPGTADSVVCGMHKPGTFGTGYGAYTGADTAEDVTDPGVIGGIGAIAPEWLDCHFLLELVSDVRKAADVICTPATTCVLPASDPTRIIFAEGDYDNGNASGEGLLFVTGELLFGGNAAWTGMIYVVGEGVFIRDGAGNGVLSGAMFVADIAGPDNIFGTADDCTGGVDGFNPAVYDGSGGGTGDEVFCTDAINPALPVHPYKIVEFLQR